MKSCDLSTGLGQTSRAFKELRERWTTARETWQDATASGFEDTHLRPLPAQIQLLITAAQQLADVLASAERDLDDRAEES